MPIRWFALGFGLVNLTLGLVAWAPLLYRDGALLGILPTSPLLNALYIAVGIWGVVACLGLRVARVYGWSMTWGFAVLAALGIIPGLDALTRVLPLQGWAVGLHLVFAVVALGFSLSASVRPRAP